MPKMRLNIIRLYIIGLCCVIGYFILDNSNFITQLVEKSSNNRYNGFLTFMFTGLFKYGILVVGICIIAFLSFLLLREKFKKAR